MPKLNKDFLVITILLFLFSLSFWFWFNYKILSSSTDEKQIAKVTSSTKTWSIEENWEKNEVKINDKRDKYVLLSWLPGSPVIKNTLIVLYNIEDKTFNYFPYDYHIAKYKEKTDTSLGYLTWEEIMDYFIKNNLNIIDFIEFDRDIVFQLFIENMNVDDEKYIINIVYENWDKKKIIIPSKEWFYQLLAKEHLSNFQNLENLQHQFLLLLKNKNFLDEYITWEISNKSLYQKNKMLSISEKNFEKKYINRKNLSFDENNEYLKALANDAISKYVEENKIKNDEIKQNKIDNEIPEKKTLKEKISELKAKKKETLSLKEKILEQRKQKQK